MRKTIHGRIPDEAASVCQSVLGAERQRESDLVSGLEKLRDKRIITVKFMKTLYLVLWYCMIPG